MEARVILLTSLVFAIWTSTTTAQCLNVPDGDYCDHCWQPIKCKNGVLTVNSPCSMGEACTENIGTAYCVSHTETDCACTGASVQCDAYNPVYIETCSATSGPISVQSCPTANICFEGNCRLAPPCNKDHWSVLAPECTAAYFCDINGIVSKNLICADGEYINSKFECVRGPPPGCDGTCSGKCPNPVDCTKFLICDGTTVIAEDDCLPSDHFDIITNECMNTGFTCTFLDGCALSVGFGTTTTDGIATTTTGTSTTTDGPGFTVPPDNTCDSSTVGSKFPLDNCSKQYCKCAEVTTGQYDYINATCLGDYYFDTDPTNPYCTFPENIDTCP